MKTASSIVLATVIRALFIAASTALLGVTGCGKHEVAHRSLPPASVRVATLAPSPSNDWIDAVGSLRSVREATIASKVMGTVVQIRRQAGEAVRKGEVLVVIDSRDVEGQIAQARGALAQTRAAAAIAETNLTRFQTLFERQAASQLELDQARFQHDTAVGAVAQAEGAVMAAESYRSYAEIPAPFDGRVVDRLCEVGDMAAPGRPLLKIEDGSRLRIDVTLADTQHAVATAGDSVRVRVPALGDRILTGRVAEVVPAADPLTRSFLVKIELTADPALRSGLYGHAMFASGERSRLTIPATAIVTRGGLSGVFVAEGDHSAFRLVTTRPIPDGSLEVLSGLSAGERIILDPPAGLEIGQPLEVQG